MATWREVKDAIAKGNADEVARLIGDDRVLLHDASPLGTWLHVAASKGQLEVLQRLILLGLDINVLSGVSQKTALSSAASGGQREIVEYLISQGAELDTSAPEKNPLFGAIYGGHPDIVRLLLASGIDAHAVYFGASARPRNALSFAIDRGQAEIESLLGSAGCVLPPPPAPPTIPEAHQQIIAVLSEMFGPVDSLALHTNLPVDDMVHSAIHVIHPNERHRCLTLFTTGMSDKPMKVPPGQTQYQYAELIMHLPADWPIPHESDRSTEAWWPIQWLRQIAYYPHESETWLGGQYTILSNEEPPQPFAANTPFSCLLLIADFAGWSPVQRDGKPVHFYTLVPLYAEERDYERQHGLMKLLESFEQNGVTTVADNARKNVALGEP